MTIDPDIRDQAYQFFIEEASELLDIIETNLLSLQQDASIQKVHELMRAAHSIKGGAASVELETIKTIAHRLEDAFKALYSAQIIVDAELETLFLRAYDCLRHPLQAQIDTGTFNEKQTLAAFDNIFSILEKRLGPALDIAESFMPSAADLGVDIVTSIFEVDIAGILTQLRNILANPEDYDCTQELQTQLGVLAGFAELFNLSSFTEIITVAQTAANGNRTQPLPVIEQIIYDVDRVRTAILAGDRATISSPSDQLLALGTEKNSEQLCNFELSNLNPDALEQPISYKIEDLTVTSSDNTATHVSTLEEIWSTEALGFPLVEELDNDNLASDPIPSDLDALADVWSDLSPTTKGLDLEVTDFEAVMADTLLEPMMESWLTSSPSEIEHSKDETNIPNAPKIKLHETPDISNVNDIEAALNLVSDLYDSLPKLAEQKKTSSPSPPPPPVRSKPASRLSAKISLERLEQMNDLVGELAINRNSQSLPKAQFQRTIHQLGQKFSLFRTVVKQLQTISDQLLVSPNQQASTKEPTSALETVFDSLEMDSYSEINSLLEGVLEEFFQLSESIDDIALFARQSNQLLERQRHTLKQLQNELMWSRMVSLNQVLKRFPRVIRELSNTYQKPVQLELTGTDVLVDRVVLEKLYDPLLHLLRNSFDHGIESSEKRLFLGKPEQGTIKIRAYYQGNYTVIEIEDDGCGLDTDKIAQRAVEAQLLSPEQIKGISQQDIHQLIFEPGFSTASKVSELSGRGVGLDVVKESLQAFNGKLSLTTNQSKGTIFSLKIPLTLTLTKLVVGNIGTVAVAIASNSIEAIIRPTLQQLKQLGDKHFLYWKSQLIPMYQLTNLLHYQCQPPKQLSPMLKTYRTGKSQQETVLIIQQGQRMIGLGLEQIITEQELVVKPMGRAVAAPDYVNGCTVLADGSLVPVIDAAALVDFKPASEQPLCPQPQRRHHIHRLMIIDDSSALRRTLALTLRKAGYQVLQAKDGRDALEQLQRGTLPDLIICDVEMPRLNGFDFLSHRRANSAWAQIPTMMLTSRGSHKHHTLAKQLGANDYFTKPYIEKEILNAIATHLQQQA
mgnify:CR=1 FL=1